jgi:hypothetical protein
VLQPRPGPRTGDCGETASRHAGAVIGEISVVARNIFDTDDPKEDYTLFRWANALHIHTRESVIRRALLFRPGDKVSVRVLEETERLLLSHPYLYDVQFRPLAARDGKVDIEVSTRDTWSLDLGLRASRTGGQNSSGFQITDQNLLGTGTTFGIGRDNDVDRSSNQIFFANDRAFGTWTSLRFSHASNSDGYADSASVVRPFYELDARWAAGVAASRYDRIDSIYNAGEIVSQYRHGQRRAEAFGGWSPSRTPMPASRGWWRPPSCRPTRSWSARSSATRSSRNASRPRSTATSWAGPSSSPTGWRRPCSWAGRPSRSGRARMRCSMPAPSAAASSRRPGRR